MDNSKHELRVIPASVTGHPQTGHDPLLMVFPPDDDEGTVVAEVHTGQEDAEQLAVRWNSHDKLVAALEKAVLALRRVNDDLHWSADRGWTTGPWAEVEGGIVKLLPEALKQAEAALAGDAAKGR